MFTQGLIFRELKSNVNLKADQDLFKKVTDLLSKSIDVHLYSSDHELWGCATLISIEKHSIAYPKEIIHFALIIKMQIVNEEMKVDAFKEKDYQSIFNNFIEPYFQNYLFKPESKAFFYKNYQEIINGISNSGNYQYFKNDKEESETFLMDQGKIVECVVDFDEWNLRSFFLETESSYMYFDWATSA